MVSFNKFNQYVQDLHSGVHNLGSHTLKVLLTNTAPTASNAVLADLTEISAGNGYSAGGTTLPVTSSTQSSGTYSLVCADLTIATATGGSIGPWRYAVLYNSTPSSPLKPLIGWWDKGSSVTTLTGDPIVLDLGATVLTSS